MGGIGKSSYRDLSFDFLNHLIPINSISRCKTIRRSGRYWQNLFYLLVNLNHLIVKITFPLAGVRQAGVVGGIFRLA